MKKLIKFEDNHITQEMLESSYYGDYIEYCRADYACIGGEIALWRAVLLQYLTDLNIKSTKRKHNAKKVNAYNWFFDKNNRYDVRKVCEYAGYEYRSIMKIANNIVEKRNLNYLKQISL